MRIYYFIFFVFLMLVGETPYSRGQCPGIQTVAGSLRIAAQPNSVIVKAGAPIPINLTVTNISKAPVRFWRDNVSDPGGYTYKVSLVASNNDPVEKTRRAKILDGDIPEHDLLPRERTVRMVTSGACMTLKPNESIRESIDLSKLFVINANGDYRAAISISGNKNAIEAAKMPTDAAARLSLESSPSTVVIALRLGTP
jgi:hypothetical protein